MKLSDININKRDYRKHAVIPLLLILVLSLSALHVEDNSDRGLYNLRYPANFGNRTNIAENNPLTKAGVALGRRLFYEGRLSANNKISCGSCHVQAQAFSDSRPFSIGVDGSATDRNSMALINLLWNRRFFWDARSGSLEDQAGFPMTNPHEMGQSLAVSVKKLQSVSEYRMRFQAAFKDGQINAVNITKALAQFERTLISSDSRYDQFLATGSGLSDSELRGMLLFNTSPNPERGIRGANCAHCHGGTKNYLELLHNNGLDQVYADLGIGAITGLKSDEGRFKVPTLRNIALTAPYMHDGRFRTLAQVIEHYSEHLQESVSLSAFLQNESNVKGDLPLRLLPQEKKDLIAFLNSLTDSTFVSNPEFSNPFINPKYEKN